ncbi:MAG: SRPBCC family protein [Campylobacterota bacterium]|nr:SRPBCC family protein [Campylobacterota bacterium]
MKTITKTSLINCTLEELFEFHLDSENITKITPKDTKVELLNEDTTTYEGKIVKIKTVKFFIPTYWEVKIKKLQKPDILVDVAVKSPFKYWKHQHIFTKKDNVCELKDIIEYKLPFGILGKIVEPFIEADIRNMFDYRHKKTKDILENYK